MAVSITKTEKFTNPTSSISFSQIRAEFGGNPTNVRAATYRRNTSDQVDWNGENATSISPRIPDAVENENVSSNNNWSIDSLRNTITDYVVTQSGTNEELSYTSNDTSTWNGNLSRNVLKKFDVTGTIYTNEVSKDALVFSGNLYNLEIEVDENGQILGEGGASGGGNGGDALYVNNTYTKSDVEIRSYGKIYSGGGGGASGNNGNSGGSINNCSSTSNFNTSNPFNTANGRNLGDAAPGQSCRAARSGATWVSANQNSVRNRCRGGGARRGNGDYPGGSYQCSPTWTILCQQTNYFSIGGGSGGIGGTGGPGRGFSNQNSSLAGNPGNSGGTNSCNGGTSTGNSGNPGTDGGDWGQSVVGGGSGGKAVLKKNARVEYYTENTLKGSIQNI